MARKGKRDHPDSDPSDPIHGMTRSQQTIIFRLRTGHNRLRQHRYKRFKVGDSEICACGQALRNTEHVFQTCSSHRQLRARTLPNHTLLEKKLYGTTEELALTVDYNHCGIGSLYLTDSCRKNEEEEEEEEYLQKYFEVKISSENQTCNYRKMPRPENERLFRMYHDAFGFHLNLFSTVTILID